MSAMTETLSAKHRILLFLYGAPHIAGSAAALLGLGLYFAGIIDRFWWAIVPAIYAAAFLLVPRQTSFERVLRSEFSEANIRDRLDEVIKAAKHQVPAAAGHRLEAIRAHADLLLPKLQELTERGALVQSVRHDVLQTLTRYLPDVLSAYMRLPAAYAKLVADEKGRTPQDLLVDQLRLLEENLASACKEAYAEDIATLEVHGRFLKEKFQTSLV
jgi:hypothetical protein